MSGSGAVDAALKTLADALSSAASDRVSWLAERATLVARAETLEARLKAKDVLQNQLLRRIKMLEFALAQERALRDGRAADWPKPQAAAAAVAASTAAREAAEAGDGGQRASSLVSLYMSLLGVDYPGASALASGAVAAAARPAASSGERSAASLPPPSAGGRGRLIDLSAVDPALLGPRSGRSKPALAPSDRQVSKQSASRLSAALRGPPTDAELEAAAAESSPAAPEVHSAEEEGGKLEEMSDGSGGEPAEPLPAKEESADDARAASSAAGDGHAPAVAVERSAPSSPLMPSVDNDGGSDAVELRPKRLKMSLLGHMDGVRSLSFHPRAPLLASGSQDGCIKLWPMRGRVTEPSRTLRSHLGPILCVRMFDTASDGDTVLFSAGADGMVAAWPVGESVPSAPVAYGARPLPRTVALHDAAVWDVALHSSGRLCTASADGFVGVWRLSDGAGGSAGGSDDAAAAAAAVGDEDAVEPLHLMSLSTEEERTIGFASVDALRNDSVLAAIGNCAVQFDLESGAAVAMYDNDAVWSGDAAVSVNALVVHDTLHLAFTASNDCMIRYWDTRDGSMVAQFVAHKGGVAALALDATGNFLLSAGHDASMRVWSIATRKCCQELSGHRKKWDEAIHSLAVHKTLDFWATGGAEGAVRVYQ
eukprot:PLAT14633.2.p1 GENE.PLAT14633.2~~PLAT14633.2.p1  ORF type:complete len:653 (+),score=246.21 PLAT14633.2:1-1959(+)